MSDYSALGLHGEHAPGQHNEDKEQSSEVVSKYLKHHLLPQIYFDLWPIFLGTLLILVIQRTQLVDPNNLSWLGTFQILFEVTSGYGSSGLSYGNPCVSYAVISALLIVQVQHFEPLCRVQCPQQAHRTYSTTGKTGIDSADVTAHCPDHPGSSSRLATRYRPSDHVPGRIFEVDRRRAATD